MKPVLYSFPKTQQESFSVQTEAGLSHFYDVLHYHPELQITIILESYGTYFIGDSIERFQSGDIFLIGPNLPHVFRNDQAFYREDSKLRASFISMYFNDQSFGKEFFDLPEMWYINQLLKKASRGIKAHGRTKDIVGEKMKRLVQLEGFDRFLMLLSILNTIATSTEWEFISKVSFSAPQKETDSKKINDVFDYIMNNFSQSISLDTVASVANMSTTAFSRYFKQRTQKTFSNFLSEVRIGHACKLLIEGEYNITEISYACGYNNISNFNRQFKHIAKFTPSEYIKRYKNQN